jgi:hypothetical protein
MEAPIPPRRVTVFKPSAILKRRINLGSAPNRNEEIGLEFKPLKAFGGFVHPNAEDAQKPCVSRSVATVM